MKRVCHRLSLCCNVNVRCCLVLCLLDVICLTLGVKVNVNGHSVRKVWIVRKSGCIVMVVKEVTYNVNIVVVSLQ